MIGQRFGRLVVTARSWYTEHVEVLCDCGQERTVRTTNLRDGHTQSWGRCECRGECNKHSAPCAAVNHQPHPETGSRVVLTTAHLNHDPSCGDLEQLRHMCQQRLLEES